jgi:hypothetical protein
VLPGRRRLIPPTTAEGLWVIKHWAPWLDPMHPNPAQPGDLRWFTTGEDGSDQEVECRGPHTVNGEEVFARSRTYMPAKLSDNPDLARTNYAAVLAGLDPKLRAVYRDGNFSAGLEDHPNQVIPTAWIEAPLTSGAPVTRRIAMAALQNTKHEAFAQGVADGKSQAEAYLSAGYGGNAKAAAVSARVRTQLNQSQYASIATKHSAERKFCASLS